MSVAVSSIFSTQCWCSALPLALMGTVVGSFCGFANHTPHVHIGLREEHSPCDISKEILGTQQRKDSVSLRVICLWYSQPGLLTYQTT